MEDNSSDQTKPDRPPVSLPALDPSISSEQPEPEQPDWHQAETDAAEPQPDTSDSTEHGQVIKDEYPFQSHENPTYHHPENTQAKLAQEFLEANHGNLEAALAALRQAANDKPDKPEPEPAPAPSNTHAAPQSDKVVISIQDAAKHYKVGRTKVDALKGVNLDIYEGEFLAITGTSGSGKSTLLQMIGGLDKLNGGKIEVLGQNIAKLRDGKLSKFRNQTIGFVFQFFYLQPFLNLQTNVEVPAMFARTKHRVRYGRSRELVETVGLGERRRHLPRELSGGQLQRAAIARALQNQPKILLADEPTGNLDSTNALAIFELFKKIRDEQGTTVIVVTHDLQLAAMADRSVHMSDGILSS